jgi:hypothetical protein
MKMEMTNLTPRNNFEKTLQTETIETLRKYEIVSDLSHTDIEKAIELYVSLPQLGVYSSLIDEYLAPFHKNIERLFSSNLDPYQIRNGGSYEVELSNGVLSFHAENHSAAHEYAGQEWDNRTEPATAEAVYLFGSHNYNNSSFVAWTSKTA